MNLALGLAVYFVIWWITLFAVLPWGVRSQEEQGEVVEGSEPGAPARPRLVRVVLVNTLLAAAIWAIVNFLYIRLYLNS